MELQHFESNVAVSEASTRRAFLRIAGVAAVAVAGVLVSPSVPAFADQRRGTPDAIVGLAKVSIEALDGGAGLASAEFRQARERVASAAAVRLGLEASRLSAAWAQADLDHQLAMLTGLTQLGVPYRRNASSPAVGFDCSGLTSFAWAGAGYELTRQSTAQIRRASPRTFETAQAGDLVQYPGHIMMWLGWERAVLQSHRSGRTVEIVRYREGRSVRVGDPAAQGDAGTSTRHAPVEDIPRDDESVGRRGASE